MGEAKALCAPLCPGLDRFIAEAAEAYAGTTGAEPLDEQRVLYASFSQRFRRPRPEGLTVEDAVLAAGLGDVPVRLYRPACLETNQPAPCILYMHGGGWVLGSVDTHDCITAEIAESTGAIVVSVDYALAPEHPFPMGFNQCRAALQMLAQEAAAFGI